MSDGLTRLTGLTALLKSEPLYILPPYCGASSTIVGAARANEIVNTDVLQSYSSITVLDHNPHTHLHSTQHSALSTQHSALSTQHSALSVPRDWFWRSGVVEDQEEYMEDQEEYMEDQEEYMEDQGEENKNHPSVECCGPPLGPGAWGGWGLARLGPGADSGGDRCLQRERRVSGPSSPPECSLETFGRLSHDSQKKA
ncbi:hypothetical protein SARC_00540 [Sphaeroforma arctica JP610]|uniref:Uncharacterized protein n=1 Tax=Sphaeroforma arctica JP610 TaxID=667725 RepID=A0A0L0GEA4_9EUKA|nr:hypothetical protein SARC_00540 [Sphaeroforma arctica JP610]KNC87350.1 hypothetical protein SARC_00540 [Sphaeroforma arctica JP610]|eukprot:XP_014161252.1 hypothetical protein SARC_00540 [Sphaeroforma arctica JP610]